jgi:hypothetical protein
MALPLPPSAAISGTVSDGMITKPLFFALIVLPLTVTSNVFH